MSTRIPPDVGRIEMGMIRRIEHDKKEKLKKAQMLKKKNNWTGLAITGMVLGVCMSFPFETDHF